jgi:hypothetical protein
MGFLGAKDFGFLPSGSGGGSSVVVITKKCSIPIGTSIVDTSAKLGYNSAFYNYTLYDCTNYVSGTLIAVWNPQTNQIQWSETTTNSIGNTTGYFLTDNLGNFIVDNLGNFITIAGVSFTFTIVGNAVNLNVIVPTTGWKMTYSKMIFEDCCTTPIVSGAFITTESSEDLITEGGDFLITE